MGIVDRLTIRGKVALAPLVLVMALIIIGTVAFLLLADNARRVEQLETGVLAKLEAVEEFDTELERTLTALYRLTSIASSETDEAKLARMAKEVMGDATTLAEAWRAVDAAIAGMVDPDLLAPARDGVAKFAKGAAMVADMAETDEGMALTMMTATARNHKTTGDAVGRIKGFLQAEKAAQEQAIVSSMRAGRYGFAGAVGVVSLLAIALVYHMSARISAPFTALTSTLQRLAHHDYDVRVPCVHLVDEAGEMARAIDFLRQAAAEADRLSEIQRREQEVRVRRAERLTEITSAFDRKVGDVVQAVATAAAQLEGTSGVMNQAAVEANGQASLVKSASEDATGSVQAVAAAAEQLSGSIAEIARQVASSSHITRGAVGDARRTEEAVGELDATVRRIGDVVQLINDIAGQTNLLALNATIEAARAGEAGKGFAVVANEVKSLANQTAKATEEISQQIGAVQEHTRKVVDAIRAIVVVIQEVGEISGGIASAVEEQNAATGEIARSVGQAAQGTAEVGGTVSSLQGAAARTGNAAVEVQDAAVSMSQQATLLKQTIGGFLTEVRLNLS